MVSFKMFAGTNVGLRENNEDNFTVSPDLTKNEWIVPADNQQVIQLGSRGCVMAVADGMGGQNAGEVASAIAIDTVEEMFSPNNLSSDVFAKSDTIISFLKKVISECDIRIKKRTEEDPSTEGMGSTIVISWLIGRKLYIAWLGDSRAYSFVKTKGIARLSKDHSYVQQLVDAGAITDEEAMSHPNSNVITRSLGDTSQKAKADAVGYNIEDNQIILLCSDGLCGVCKDEEIGGIIEEENADLQKCKEHLTTAALAAGGSDNITISLLHITVDAKTDNQTPEIAPSKFGRFSLTIVFAIVFGLGLFSFILYAGYSLVCRNGKTSQIVKTINITVDKNVLSQNESSRYHVILSDGTLSYEIIYDKSLLSIDTKDSLVRRNQTMPSLSKDLVTRVKVVCREDTTIMSSVSIRLTKDVEKILGEEDFVSEHPVHEVKKEKVREEAEGSAGSDEQLILNESKQQNIGTVNEVK